MSLFILLVAFFSGFFFQWYETSQNDFGNPFDHFD